jgi:ATP-dependent helicase/nuclease subunit A
MSGESMIHDATERKAALDPSKSFIVQAPAGSGKTELLAQRFLVLLATVNQPEEILAITFTKKSAAEMRMRIISALKKAHMGPPPEAAHARTTYDLAQQVLERDAQKNWQLIANPNRLRIQTMDAFNAFLTKQLPLLSRFGATPDISEDFYFLYQEAVNEFLTHLEEDVAWSNDIALLLMHLDNDLNKVAELLINMLAKRDQWLPYITLNAHEPTLRQALEVNLAAITEESLQTLVQVFPKNHGPELLELARYAAAQLKAQGQTAHSILTCLDLTVFPGSSIQDKPIWLGFADLLLTQEDEWRKRIDKNLGFPPATQFSNPSEKKLATDAKTRMSELIQQLLPNEKLAQALINLRKTPPCTYSDTQWQLLQALHQILQILVAQLKVIFEAHGKIDYIENAEAAFIALGDEETPTDLNLALDYQLRHILIDEFQDTSNNQQRLIVRLTQGWETGDGRTLFVVGDPMQSIYRFREAEVGLFIRAQREGLGQIKLEPLVLRVNFRSHANIVAWINQHFKLVFPKQDDMRMGAVSYSASIPHSENNDPYTAVQLHALEKDKENAADALVSLIQHTQATQPLAKIAILVRSRHHLAEIIPRLQALQIPYRAIDIDPLSARPVVQDLMALTFALLHPGDRIAWLSILRAPWIGLSLTDLWKLAGAIPEKSIYECLSDQALCQTLSADGQLRLQRSIRVLLTKMGERKRHSLRNWVESTWILLGGPAVLKEACDLDNAEAYFKLLEKYEDAGDLKQIHKLKEYVNQLFAAPNGQADDQLQIMTIHNSKGLEFDVVILPELDRQAPSDERQLLIWMENNAALLWAPIQGSGQGSDAIYSYIKSLQAIKNDYEMGRLLYVAATRAKCELHLFFSLEKEAGTPVKPHPKSLLAKLWPSIQSNVRQITPLQDVQVVKEEKSPNFLSRLSLTWMHPLLAEYAKDAPKLHQKPPSFQLPEEQAKNIGTIIHRFLQHIGAKGTAWWEKAAPSLRTQFIDSVLREQHFLTNEIPAARALVTRAIATMLQDARGRWILAPHTDAKNEYSLCLTRDNLREVLTIDRTFVDVDGICWLIDYKNTTPAPGQSLEAFLKEEEATYLQKLLTYRAALQTVHNHPIKMALYFPLIPAWYEVSQLENEVTVNA